MFEWQIAAIGSMPSGSSVTVPPRVSYSTVYRFVQLVVCGQFSGLVLQGLDVIRVGVAPSSPQAIFDKEEHAEKAALRTAEG